MPRIPGIINKKGETLRNIDRKFVIDVTMDGTLTVRDNGKRKLSVGSLPVFSTDSKENAGTLVQLVSKLHYDGRQVVPGFLDRAEDIGIEAIFELEERFETFHRNMV